MPPLIQFPNNRKSLLSYRILYIGDENVVHVRNLLSKHDVISTNNISEAIAIIENTKRNNLQPPEAILMAKRGNDKTSINKFVNYLNRDDDLQALPFLQIEEDDKLEYQNRNLEFSKGPDDLISTSITSENLYNKITLIKKFKQLKRFQNKIQNIDKNEIPLARQALYPWDSFLKRLIDIIVSSGALIALCPIFILIAILIKLDSKGPVFYLSNRAGSNYKIFKFIKFRSMIVQADRNLSRLIERNQYSTNDKNSPLFIKISDDPRITKIGKFLRNTSLDELPQLINVFRGDMSLVGNRPLPLYEAKTLTTDKHAQRFNAPAGITGLWQIEKRGQKEMSTDERIALDIRYARHNSIIRDVNILLKTPKAIIQKDNV